MDRIPILFFILFLPPLSLFPLSVANISYFTNTYIVHLFLLCHIIKSTFAPSRVFLLPSLLFLEGVGGMK